MESKIDLRTRRDPRCGSVGRHRHYALYTELIWLQRAYHHTSIVFKRLSQSTPVFAILNSLEENSLKRKSFHLGYSEKFVHPIKISFANSEYSLLLSRRPPGSVQGRFSRFDQKIPFGSEYFLPLSTFFRLLKRLFSSHDGTFLQPYENLAGTRQSREANPSYKQSDGAHWPLTEPVIWRR